MGILVMSYLGKGFLLVRDFYRYLVNGYRLCKYENGGDEIIYISRYWLFMIMLGFRGIIFYF